MRGTPADPLGAGPWTKCSEGGGRGVQAEQQECLPLRIRNVEQRSRIGPRDEDLLPFLARVPLLQDGEQPIRAEQAARPRCTGVAFPDAAKGTGHGLQAMVHPAVEVRQRPFRGSLCLAIGSGVAVVVVAVEIVP